jgi:hypothetical protein
MASQLDAILDWGMAVIGLAAVAATVRQITLSFLSPEPTAENEFQTQTIPDDKRTELEEKYGKWAVKTAIAVCPFGDIECVEREAKRLYGSRELRRR